MRDFNPKFSYPHLNIKIKPVAIYVWHNLGLGDNMFLSPLIRKFYDIYNEKITLFIPNWKIEMVREFYKNNPYVEKIITVGDSDGEENWEITQSKYDIFFVYNEDNKWGAYAYMDLRQLVSSQVGITLKDEESHVDYFPDPYIPIDELPEKFICINPYISGIDRTWEKEKWQDLVDRLNKDGIYVVSIGKGEPNKHYYNLDIKLGANLCNKECQNNLSQTWHILNKSEYFVTFDCSIFVLASSTNTNIIQIGWYADPYFHIPIRNGIKGYKYENVKGECDVYCSTDPRFDVKEFGTIKEKHPVQVCMLDRNWICKPTSEKVYNKIKEVIGRKYL